MGLRNAPEEELEVLPEEDAASSRGATRVRCSLATLASK